MPPRRGSSAHAQLADTGAAPAPGRRRRSGPADRLHARRRVDAHRLPPEDGLRHLLPRHHRLPARGPRHPVVHAALWREGLRQLAGLLPLHRPPSAPGTAARLHDCREPDLPRDQREVGRLRGVPADHGGLEQSAGVRSVDGGVGVAAASAAHVVQANDNEVDQMALGEQPHRALLAGDGGAHPHGREQELFHIRQRLPLQGPLRAHPPRDEPVLAGGAERHRQRLAPAGADLGRAHGGRRSSDGHADLERGGVRRPVHDGHRKAARVRVAGAHPGDSL
mmetsp:Transcript_110770/g.294242  ORF Transcript_110770/g.294242 Transcript_110770/m.294242 type:complete len:279 (-) Transcript_110770:504-1340(-)